jgi:hypothetical protein
VVSGEDRSTTHHLTRIRFAPFRRGAYNRGILTPEFAAEVADECQWLLQRLDDPELRSVKRKLQLIRTLWEQEVTP